MHSRIPPLNLPLLGGDTVGGDTVGVDYINLLFHNKLYLDNFRAVQTNLISNKSGVMK